MQAVFEAMAVGDTRPFSDLMADDRRWISPGQSAWSGGWNGNSCSLRCANASPAKYVNHATGFIGDGDFVVVECRGHATPKSGELYHDTDAAACALYNAVLFSLTSST